MTHIIIDGRASGDQKLPYMTQEFYKKGLAHIESTSGTREEYQERMAYFRDNAEKLLAMHSKKLAGERASA